ncbi:MAG: hypothetical protein JO215_00325 [Ktedonobacteraceae bacterium]|nr:hypothetical protein [Ktedonobacteraceae bacterium]
MRHLTCSIENERDNIVNTWYATKETSSAVARLLQVVIARDDDDKDEDPDSYWHP